MCNFVCGTMSHAECHYSYTLSVDMSDILGIVRKCLFYGLQKFLFYDANGPGVRVKCHKYSLLTGYVLSSRNSSLQVPIPHRGHPTCLHRRVSLGSISRQRTLPH